MFQFLANELLESKREKDNLFVSNALRGVRQASTQNDPVQLQKERKPEA